MSIDGIAAIIFILVLAVFLWQKRKQVELQKMLFPLLYIVMYRSSFGLKSMERISKRWPRFIKAMGNIATVIGFIGMIAISAQLLYVTGQLFMGPEGPPGIQPVLPIQAKGVFFVPFLYWILSIFFLAIVHEFSHGVMARVHKIPVKSSGFAFVCFFLPIIPAAFVEPDDKAVNKKSHRVQHSMFAAGPVSNLLFALIMLGIFAAVSPIMTAAFDTTGVEIVGLPEGSPSIVAGLQEGDIILSMNDIPTTSVANVSDIIGELSPGDPLAVRTTNATHLAILGPHPKNASQAFLGIQARPKVEPRPEFVAQYGAWLPPAMTWIAGLFFWLFVLNIGIGLFNLLPIGPLDGGRMFHLVCIRLFEKRTAARVQSWVSTLFIAIILMNLVAGFVR